MENYISPVNIELYTRLIVAMLLGLVVGTERIIAHKTAGMRTYALISMGAALFVILSGLIYTLYPNASFNGAYIPAAVITGVGFFGAGLMIWRDSDHLVGITSAAGLWIAAGIGIACGYGFYKLATVATILVIFIFVVLWFIEQKIKKAIHFDQNAKKVQHK
jgi:putative Mg2+ transporter-C (MgtC) family protein